MQSAGNHEQGGGTKAVSHHLHYRTLQCQLVPRVNAENDETHMTHTAIGHQSLEVSLGESQNCAIDDTRYPQHHGGQREIHCRFGEQRYSKSNQAISTGLKQNACQNNTASSGRLGVRIGQPGVKWKGRQFDHKRYKETEH